VHGSPIPSPARQCPAPGIKDAGTLEMHLMCLPSDPPIKQGPNRYQALDLVPEVRDYRGNNLVTVPGIRGSLAVSQCSQRGFLFQVSDLVLNETAGHDEPK